MPHTPIDNTAYLTKDGKQSWSGWLVLSVLVHALMLAVILYFHKTPNMKTHSLQAQLVSTDTIADIKAQIQSSVATNGSSNGTTIDNPKDNINTQANNNNLNPSDSFTSPQALEQPSNSGQRMYANSSILQQSDDANRIFTPAPDSRLSNNQIQKSQAMLKYEQQLLEKEAVYQAQKQAFAKQLDAEITQEMQQQRELELQRLQEQQQTVNEYKRSENNNDSITASNREKLEAAKQANAARAAELVQEKNHPSGIIKLEYGHPTVNSKNSGMSDDSGSSRNSSTSSGNSSNSNALAIIKTKIQRHFSAPVNTSGQRSVLVIKVAQDGTVLDVTVSGSHTALNDAAKAAVYAASPLPIDPDNPKTYPTIRIGLTGTS